MTRLFLSLCLVMLLISGCQTTEVMTVQESRTSPAGDTRHRMEEAIARRILMDVQNDLPSLPVAEQSGYLREKITLFEASVDLQMTSERVAFEKKLLDYLYLQSDLATFGSGYLPVLQKRTTLDWSLPEYRQVIEQELIRIDQTIAVLTESSPGSFDMPQYVEVRRKRASYPEDSFEGRQSYLDALADAMLEAQLDWYDTLENYEESELAIFGEQDQGENSMGQMFRFSPAGLTINLTNVRDLPDFETKALAVYYGFPGMRSISVNSSESLKQFLRISAYQHGWGAYMVDHIGNRDTKHTIDYLLYARMLAALALADFNLHTGSWNRNQAKQQLHSTLPLSDHRIELMLNQLELEPGHFVATLAGKSEFTRMQEQCLDQGLGDVCHSVFHQRIVDWGPIPFALLEERLFQ